MVLRTLSPHHFAPSLDCAKSFRRSIAKSSEKDPNSPLYAVPEVHVLRASVFRLKAPTHPGGFRYLAVEEKLEGAYEKWNNNDGFVNQSDDLKCKVAQAFSHFSYEKSNQQELIVDIQGCGGSKKCVYTDPALHSVTNVYGKSDRGPAGMQKFFRTHKCNFICRGLGLPQRSESGLL